MAGGQRGVSSSSSHSQQHQQPSKQRVSALDIRALMSSIRPKVVGLRLANIYDFSSSSSSSSGKGGGGGGAQSSYILKFAGKDSKIFLFIHPGFRVYTTEWKKDKGTLPSPFCMRLRKSLRTKKLEDIQQHGADRVISLIFGKGENRLHLIVELYVAGNILLTDYQHVMLAVLRRHTLVTPVSKENEKKDHSSAASSGVSPAISKVQKFAVKEVYQISPPALSLLRHGISPGVLTPEIIQKEIIDIFNGGAEKDRGDPTALPPGGEGLAKGKTEGEESSSSSSSSGKKKSRDQMTYQQILSMLVPFSNPALALHALLTATEGADRDIHKRTLSRESLDQGCPILYKAVIECLKALRSVSSSEDYVGGDPSMPSSLSLGAEAQELPIPGWILATRRGDSLEKKEEKRDEEGDGKEGDKTDTANKTALLYDYDDFSPILLRQYQSLRVLPAPQQIQLEEELKASMAVVTPGAGDGGRTRGKEGREEEGKGDNLDGDLSSSSGSEKEDELLPPDKKKDVGKEESLSRREGEKKGEREKEKSLKLREGVEAAIQAVHGDVVPGTRVLLYFKDINRCVDEFFSSGDIQKGEKAELQAKKEALSRVDKIRTDQDQRIKQLENEIADLHKQTSSLSTNILLVDQIIQLIRTILATGADWREVKRQMQEQKKAGHPLVTHIHDIKFSQERVLVLLPQNRDGPTTRDEDQEEEKTEDAGKSSAGSPAEKQEGGEYYDDELMETVLVSMDFSLSAHANVELLYSQIKQLKSKLQKTISAKEIAMAHADKKAKKRIELHDQQFLQQQLQLQKLRKPFWFEKFLWFITSDSYLVLAGRDSQQNEILFRRYLRPHDIYVHADIHGAATCIIKNRKPHSAVKTTTSKVASLDGKKTKTHGKEGEDDEGLSEDQKVVSSSATNTTGKEGGSASDVSSLPVPLSTLQQCGEYAVCRSSAWKSKTPAAAWWVYGRQVSKSAPSGLYLSTGSFMIRGKRNFIPVHRLEMGFGLLFRLGDEASVSRHLPASHYTLGGIRGGDAIDSDVEDNTVDIRFDDSTSPPVEKKKKNLAFTTSEESHGSRHVDKVGEDDPNARTPSSDKEEKDEKKGDISSSLTTSSNQQTSSSSHPVMISSSPESVPSPGLTPSSSVRKRCAFTTPEQGGGGDEPDRVKEEGEDDSQGRTSRSSRQGEGKKSARIGFVQVTPSAEDRPSAGEEDGVGASSSGEGGESAGACPSGGEKTTGGLLQGYSSSVTRRRNRKPTGYLRDADVRKKAGLEALREVIDSRRASDVEVSLRQREDVLQQLEQQAERQRQLEEQLAQVKQQLEAQLREASTSPSRATHDGSRGGMSSGGASTDRRRPRFSRGSVEFDPLTIEESESQSLRDTPIGRRIRRRHPTGHLTAKDVAELRGELAGEEIRQMQEEVAEEQAREALRLEEEAKRSSEKKEDETQQENGILSSHSTPSLPPTGASLETLVPLQQELLQRQYSAETHQRLMMEKLREVALQHGVEGIVPPSSTSGSGGGGAIQTKDSLGGLLRLDSSSSRSTSDRHHRHSHHSLDHSHSRHRRSFRAGKGSGTDDCHVTFSPDPPKVVEKTITALHVDFDGLPPEVIPPRPDDDCSGGDPLLLRLEEELKEEAEEETQDKAEGGGEGGMTTESSSSFGFKRRGTGWVRDWRPPSDDEEDVEERQGEESFEALGEEGGPPEGFLVSSTSSTARKTSSEEKRDDASPEAGGEISHGGVAKDSSSSSCERHTPQEGGHREDSAPVCLRLITHDNETGEISAIELGSSIAPGIGSRDLKGDSSLSGGGGGDMHAKSMVSSVGPSSSSSSTSPGAKDATTLTTSAAAEGQISSSSSSPQPLRTGSDIIDNSSVVSPPSPPQHRRDSTVSFSGEGDDEGDGETRRKGEGYNDQKKKTSTTMKKKMKNEDEDDGDVDVDEDVSKENNHTGGEEETGGGRGSATVSASGGGGSGLSSRYSSSRLNSRGLTMTSSSRQDSWRRSPSAYSERSILSVQSSTSIGSRVSRRMSVDEGPPPDGFTEETLPTPRELLSHSSLDIQNSGGDDDTSDEREIHIIVRRLSIKEEKELVRCRSADRGPTPKGFSCTDVPSAKDLLTLQQYLAGKLSSPDQGRSEDDATTSAGTRRSRRVVSEGHAPSVFSEVKRLVSSGGEEGREEDRDEIYVDLCSSDHLSDEEEEEEEDEKKKSKKEQGEREQKETNDSHSSSDTSSEDEDEDDTSTSNEEDEEGEEAGERREVASTGLEEEEDTTEDDEDTDHAVEEEEEKTRKEREKADAMREEEEEGEEGERDETGGAEEGGNGKKKRLSAAERRRLKKKKSLGEDGEEEEQGGEQEDSSSNKKEKKKKDPSLKPLPRGKKSRLTKMKKKYAEQDEEERKLKMSLIGAGEMKEFSTPSEPAEKRGVAASSSSSSRKTQAPASGKRDEDWRDETKKSEEENFHTQDSLQEVVADDKLLVEQCNQIDLLTPSPLPEDALLCAVPVTAPYSAMAKYRYKMKLLPGSMKKGKAGQSILKHFLQNVDDIRQKQLIKGITMSEIALCMVSDVRLSSPGLSKQAAAGETRQQKKKEKKQKKQLAADE